MTRTFNPRLGGKWAFMEKVEIGHLVKGKPLMTRLRVISTPWFGVHIHWLHRKDDDRDLHNHPWPFASVILRGGYVEEIKIGEGSKKLRYRSLGVGTFATMPLAGQHRICTVLPDTMTLILRGPKTREWGFFTPIGYVPHYEYAGDGAYRPVR